MLFLQQLKCNRVYRNIGNVKNNEPPPINGRYNCWGFVAYAFGWYNDLHWLDADVMHKLLLERSVVIDEPVDGCIAVYRDFGNELNYGAELTHTAILANVEKGLVIHKPGDWKLELISLEDMLVTHECYCEFDEFRIAI